MKKDKRLIELEKFWETIDSNSTEFFDKNFERIAINLLEFLVLSLVHRKEIEIGTFRQKNNNGSIVSYDVYNCDVSLNLRLSRNNIFELNLEMYDWDGISKKYNYILNDQEKQIIPQGLTNLMEEVINTGIEEIYKIKGIR